jgi:hypothetical protein
MAEPGRVKSQTRTLQAFASGLPTGGAMPRYARYLTTVIGATFAAILEIALVSSTRQGSDSVGIASTILVFAVLGYLLGLALELEEAPATAARLERSRRLTRAQRAPSRATSRPARQWQG